jgi:DNA-binding CsgD family transcriptional regulator
VRQRQAAYYVHLVEHAAPHLQGPDQVAWLERLEAEHDNLRAVLAWSRTPGGEADLGLRLVAALHEFWYGRGYVREGRAWLEGVLEDCTEAATPLRAVVLARASYFAVQQGDHGRAEGLAEAALTLSRHLHYTTGEALALSALGRLAYLQAAYALARSRTNESLQLFRELADQEQIAHMLGRLGSLARAQGDWGQAAACHQEALTIYRTLGHIRGMGQALNGLGRTMLNLDACHRARALCEEGLALARTLKSKRGMANALRCLGDVALLEGDDTQATEHYRACLAFHRELGITIDMPVTLGNLGLVALARGAAGQAAAYFLESVVSNRDLGRKRGLVDDLASCASVACLQGHPRRAARLFGAAAALSERLGIVLELTKRIIHDRDVAATRTTLGAVAFEAAYAAGRALPVDQALADALEVVHTAQSTSPAQPAPAKPTYPADLTAREVEVLRLVAHGLTNPHIAERLCISPHTVHTHVRAIYGKLAVTTRSAATRFAVEHGLV